MQTKVAEIELTPQELANAVAERISHTRLTPKHFWNTYTLQIKIHDGEFVGGTVRYYIDSDEECPKCEGYHPPEIPCVAMSADAEDRRLTPCRA